MAIRVGRVGSDNLVARRIGETTVLAAASPVYLQRAGIPAEPADLASLACLTYSHAANGNQADFVGPDGATVSVRITGPIHSNNGMLLTEMAVADAGVVFAPCFILQPYLARGLLSQVLPDWRLRTLPIQVVYPTRRHLSAKVQAMAGFLAEWFSATPADPAAAE